MGLGQVQSLVPVLSQVPHTTWYNFIFKTPKDTLHGIQIIFNTLKVKEHQILFQNKNHLSV